MRSYRWIMLAAACAVHALSCGYAAVKRPNVLLICTDDLRDTLGERHNLVEDPAHRSTIRALQKPARAGYASLRKRHVGEGNQQKNLEKGTQ